METKKEISLAGIIDNNKSEENNERTLVRFCTGTEDCEVKMNKDRKYIRRKKKSE